MNIEDRIPTETKVETEVKELKGGRARVPSVMHTKDLKDWLWEAMRKKGPARRGWELFVILVQQTFGYGTPLAELAWATMVILPNGKGEYQGIGLVEVEWKSCAALVNFRLKRGVVLPAMASHIDRKSVV